MLTVEQIRAFLADRPNLILRGPGNMTEDVSAKLDNNLWNQKNT